MTHSRDNVSVREALLYNGYRVKVWDKDSLVVDNFYEIHQKAIALSHYDSYNNDIKNRASTHSHYTRVALLMVNERVEQEYCIERLMPHVVRIP